MRQGQERVTFRHGWLVGLLLLLVWAAHVVVPTSAVPVTASARHVMALAYRDTEVSAITAPRAVAPGGNIWLTGHDADFHCADEKLQCHYLKIALEYVRNGSPLPVLALDHGTDVENAIAAAFTATTDATPTVVVVDPRTGFARLPLLASDGAPLYSAIIVASDHTCRDCDNNTPNAAPDSDAINARAGAIAQFFNAGGGILVLAGAAHSQVYYKFLPVPAAPVAVAPPFSLTPLGLALGLRLGTRGGPISTSDVNCCATHNSFEIPGAGSTLRVVELDRAGLAETLVGRAVVICGQSFCLPQGASATATADAGTGGATATPATGRATETPAAAGATGTAISSYNPTMTLAPTTVSPGSTVTVIGHGFAPGELMTLALNGEALATDPVVVTTNSDGTFSARFSVPPGLPRGANTVSAVGNVSRTATVVTLARWAGVAVQYYFAGGVNTAREHSALAVLNPSGQAAQVSLTFYSGTSDVTTGRVTVPARTTRLFAAGSFIKSPSFGLTVVADQPVAAQLTVTRDGRDGDALLGPTGLAQRWYLAEGYTGLTFHESVAILNPDRVHTATIRLELLPFKGRRSRAVTVQVRPHTHVVVDVTRLLPARSLSVIADSDRPVVVERTLTFSGDSHGRGYGLTMRAGTTLAATSWVLAEGTTTNRFETFLTMLNPNGGVAVVTARFYGPAGRLLGSRAIRMASLSRANIKLNDVLRASGIASVVTSDRPIVVERPEYFGSPNGVRIAGSDVFGRNGAALRWTFPGGDTAKGLNDYLLFYNPSAARVPVDVTVYTSAGAPVTRHVSIAPRVRFTLNLNRLFPQTSRLHGTQVRSANAIGFVAEQTVFALDHSMLRSTQGLAQ